MIEEKLSAVKKIKAEYEKMPLWMLSFKLAQKEGQLIDIVKRYIQEQEGKKVFDYDIFECPEELKGQLKIGDFYG